MISNPDKIIPSVSIALATFNGSLHLATQLDSILQQGFDGFELIVVDDGSTDGTRSLLEKYQEKDNRIKLFYNETNLGYRSAFYRALSQCSGDFILFSDQDDIWFPDKISSLLEMIGDNLLVFSDSELIDERGNDLHIKLSDTVRMRAPGTRGINRGFVIGNCVWGHTILFHRSLLDHIGMQNDHPHDWWFAVVSSFLNRIVYYPRVLNYYRQHPKNLTQAVPGKETKRRPVKGRKQTEFETQLSRIGSIGSLSFNTDRSFYEKWHRLFIKRTRRFSFPLFFFLLFHQQGIFSMKRKNVISRLISIRKMCRKVSSAPGTSDRD